jgi:hypothetical protein
VLLPASAAGWTLYLPSASPELGWLSTCRTCKGMQGSQWWCSASATAATAALAAAPTVFAAAGNDVAAAVQPQCRRRRQWQRQHKLTSCRCP